MSPLSLHGLTLESAIDLPGLLPARGEPQLKIRLADRADPLPTPAQTRAVVSPDGFAIRVGDGEAVYHRPGAGTFLCRGGREIVVQPEPAADARVVRLALLGPAMALILEQLGRLVLHAGAVEVAERAVLICAESGGGKSTTVAALCRRGFSLLSDDLCAVRREGKTHWVDTGSARVKLWPDSVTGLGERPESLDRLHPRFDKRDWDASDRLASLPARLARIYVLQTGDRVHCESLPPSAAVEALLRHWYGARFGTALLREAGRGPHFLRCATVAASVPARRLVRPARWERLGELVDRIEQDLAAPAEGNGT